MHTMHDIFENEFRFFFPFKIITNAITLIEEGVLFTKWSMILYRFSITNHYNH